MTNSRLEVINSYLTEKKNKKGVPYFHIVVSYYNEAGERKNKWKSTNFPSKNNKTKADKMRKEFEAEWADRLAELKKGEAKKDDISFVSFVDWWIANKNKISKKQIQLTTLEGYQQEMDRYIRPYFKKLNLSLKEVTKDHLQGFFDTMHESGSLKGNGGLSATSLRQSKAVINQTLKYACKENYIPANPMASVEMYPIEKKPINSYTTSEFEYFLSLIKDEFIFHAICLLAGRYGLRLSEVMGLRWRAIDFDNDNIYINHAVVKRKTTVYKDKTKTSSSTRALPLLDEVKGKLLEVKEYQKKNKALFGNRYSKKASDYVFTWEDGKRIPPSFASHKMPDIIKKHGLKKITFHQLRHSCASILLGEFKMTLFEVKEWLGHSDISITADLYGHLAMENKRQIATKLNAKFNQKTTC